MQRGLKGAERIVHPSFVVMPMKGDQDTILIPVMALSAGVNKILHGSLLFLAAPLYRSDKTDASLFYAATGLEELA
jgi:hypothetical protein